MIHNLVSRSGTQVTAACGAEARCHLNRQPSNFTAWTSDVTCPACLHRAAAQRPPRAVPVARRRSAPRQLVWLPPPATTDQGQASQSLLDRIGTQVIRDGHEPTMIILDEVAEVTPDLLERLDTVFRKVGS